MPALGRNRHRAAGRGGTGAPSARASTARASAEPASAAVRVAVVDDHRLVLDGIAARLAAEDGIVVVARETSWAALLAHDAFPPDVVVLDLHLDDNIPIGTKLRALLPTGAACVVMSGHSDPASVSAALAAGAIGFVAKSDSADELVEAVRAARSSDRHLSSALEAAVADHRAIPDAGLGERELLALVLYAGGRSTSEVAREMGTTDETVRSYIKRGRRKYRAVGIEIGSRTLLRRHAVREGWIER